MTKTDTVTYAGRYDCGVDVLMPDGRTQHVPHGGELTTTPSHAESLLTQGGEWTRASSKPTTKEEKTDG